MAVVCFLYLESLSLKRDPWLVFTSPVTYASDVHVRAFCCQYVCMTAGSPKAPGGAGGTHREGEKTWVGLRFPSWQLTHSSLETCFSMVARGKYLVSLPKTKRCESEISALPNPFPFRLLLSPCCQSCLQRTVEEHETLTAVCLFTRPHRPTGRTNREPSLKPV